MKETKNSVVFSVRIPHEIYEWLNELMDEHNLLNPSVHQTRSQFVVWCLSRGMNVVDKEFERKIKKQESARAAKKESARATKKAKKDEAPPAPRKKRGRPRAK